MAVINPNPPTLADLVRHREPCELLIAQIFPELMERSSINMPSNSDDRQPDLPMSLPVARGPLRERAADMVCSYCGMKLHAEEERQQGACYDCEDPSLPAHQ